MKSHSLLRAVGVFALVFAVTTFAVAFTADAQEFCIQVITFAENPETGECEMFPTPCDVPEGWELCDFPVVFSDATDATASAAEKGGHVCIQVITYAEHPGTGECIAFPTPCDVPKGWQSCDPGSTL